MEKQLNYPCKINGPLFVGLLVCSNSVLLSGVPLPRPLAQQNAENIIVTFVEVKGRITAISTVVLFLSHYYYVYC
jgi:hypothetical protein